MAELRRIIEDSEVMKEDDSNWPEADRVGRQELEVVLGDEHISFCVSHRVAFIEDRGGTLWRSH